MPRPTVREEQFSQLEDVLQSSVVMLQLDDHASTVLKAQQLLKASKRCCIIASTSTSHQRLKNIKTLYRSVRMLKKLQKQLCKEYSLPTASFIGIYPSLEYPACVYELHTCAGQYVTTNVLPYDHSVLTKIIKHLIGKFLGANPAIGGLGLVLYRE